MVSVSGVFTAWQEAFHNKDSSKLAEFLTEDFRFVSRQLDIGKQETLDWTSVAGMRLYNLQTVSESDEVAVIHHPVTFNTFNGIGSPGRSTGVFIKKDGKISQCRYVRTAIKPNGFAD